MTDAETELRNWGRWCLAQGDCYPQAWVTNWLLMRGYVPYKNSYETTEQKLEAALAARPIQDHMAERVDLWVRQFGLLPRTALRVHYVYMPERLRHDWNLTVEQWNERRAHYTRYRMTCEETEPQAVDADKYLEAVADGTAGVDYWLRRWAVGT